MSDFTIIQPIILNISEIRFYNKPAYNFKGTHTVCFGSSCYIINQKPAKPRKDFHCKTTWLVRSG